MLLVRSPYLDEEKKKWFNYKKHISNLGSYNRAVLQFKDSTNFLLQRYVYVVYDCAKKQTLSRAVY